MEDKCFNDWLEQFYSPSNNECPGDSGRGMNRQEGGDHYLRLPIQPWEIIERCNLDFWEGNVIKYILRRKEDRLLDLQKARHYLDYLIQREVFLQDKH